MPIINETTTLQHHQQAAHQVKYWKWAAENGFTSILSVDTKHRQEEEARQQAVSSGSGLSQ